MIAAALTAGILVLGVTVLVADGNGGGQDVSSGTSTTEPGRKPVELEPVTPGRAITGATPCPPTDGSAPRTTSFAEPPPMCIDPAVDYEAEVRTSKGIIVIDLLEDEAPVTVNNFVVLARYHFYDGIPFHRVAPGFVIQVGDPQASGRGGPGYMFEGEVPEAGAYLPGTVAMANQGGDPSTNGSQLFIVTGDATGLAPNYSLFGKVTAGMAVAEEIEATGIPEVPGDPNGGRPTEEVTIESILIKEA